METFGEQTTLQAHKKLANRSKLLQLNRKNLNVSMLSLLNLTQLSTHKWKLVVTQKINSGRTSKMQMAQTLMLSSYQRGGVTFFISQSLPTTFHTFIAIFFTYKYFL